MRDARTTLLPAGEAVPVLGQGTWGMAERSERRADEIASLRLGLARPSSIVRSRRPGNVPLEMI